MTFDDIRTWLHDRLAGLLDMPLDEIQAANSVAELGVDSLAVARLTEELRGKTGADLPATLFYDARDFAELINRIAASIPPAMAAATARALPRRIVLAASFTIEPIEAPLAALLDASGQNATLAFAPYHQILQQLLDPAGGFAGQGTAAHVVLLRLEDWFRHALGTPTAEDVRSVVGQLATALQAARARLSGPILAVLCPHGDGAAMPEADGELISAIALIPGVDLADLRGEGGAHYDLVRDRIGHMPYTPAGYAALALRLGRVLHGCLTEPAKVLVVDCDNTLWAGVVGEDGPAGVAITAGHRALQAFLLRRKQAGQLITLASKNAEADVWAVFDSRADMLLSRADIAAWRINWQPKPDNIRAIANDLGLGLDSFIFLDDSPAECAAVAAALPQVTVVHLPADAAAFGAFLDAHWAFDTRTATAEDARRTELYAVERERRQSRAELGNVEDYLASLCIGIEITPLAEADLPRAAQLTQRTNQFNTTTLRRTEAEMAALIGHNPARALKVEVRDRFGEYGFVGLATLDWGNGACTVDSMMLSCRVLGRRVEHALLGFIAGLAGQAGVRRVSLAFRPSDRNQPARAYLQSIGAGLNAQGMVSFCVDEIDGVLAGMSAHPLPAAAADDTPAAMPDGKIAASAGLGWIAGLRGDGLLLQQALALRTRQRPALAQPFLAPQNPLHVQIAKIWAAVLRLDRVGIEDDFYELGGDSLAGAALAASLQEIGISEDIGLGLAARPTVAGLAELIQSRRSGAPVMPTASLQSFAALPADVEAAAAAARSLQLCARNAGPYTYFLTGGTGYVGGYLAAQLLKQPHVRLVCHVRARHDTEGMARIRQNLERYGLWRPDYASRISAAPGALDQPRLGMSDENYNRYAAQADAVIHNGAAVNFIFPFSHLRGTNIDGTIEAMRFAAARSAKPFHFVSTLGVLMSGYARNHVLAEDEELDRSEDLPNGYEQTKWVADKIVWRAIQAGYPASIYRLGMLSGLAESGVYHKLNEFLPSFLKGCVQLGSFPHMDSKVEMVPIDVTARILAKLIGAPECLRKTFHMNHPDPLDDADYVEVIRRIGYPIRHVPFEIWKRELIGSSLVKTNALYPFLDFIRGLQAHQTRIPDMNMANTFAVAAEEMKACPDQETLLKRYFSYFASVNYLPPPQGRAIPRVHADAAD
jgi:FkbH-like protein/thioester reductase-like protein